jgi:hypothetical protein
MSQQSGSLEVNLKEVQNVLINDEGHLTCLQGVLINYEDNLHTVCSNKL